MTDFYKKLTELYQQAKTLGVVDWHDDLRFHRWRMLDAANNARVFTIDGDRRFCVFRSSQDWQTVGPQQGFTTQEAKSLEGLLNDFKVFAPLPCLPYGMYVSGKLSGVLFLNPKSVYSASQRYRVRAFTRSGTKFPSKLFRRGRFDFAAFWKLLNQGRLCDISYDMARGHKPLKYVEANGGSALIVGNEVFDDIRNVVQLDPETSGSDFVDVVTEAIAHRV